jgi:hypothetical protein
MQDLLLCAKHLFVAAMVPGLEGGSRREGGELAASYVRKVGQAFRADMERALLAQRPAATLPSRWRRARKVSGAARPSWGSGGGGFRGSRPGTR